MTTATTTATVRADIVDSQSDITRGKLVCVIDSPENILYNRLIVDFTILSWSHIGWSYVIRNGEHIQIVGLKLHVEINKPTQVELQIEERSRATT